MKYSLDSSNSLEEISSLSHSIVFLYFFALFIEEGLLISPCYSLELCIQFVYLSLFPSFFTSLSSSVICKAFSNNQFETVCLIAVFLVIYFIFFCFLQLWLYSFVKLFKLTFISSIFSLLLNVSIYISEFLSDYRFGWTPQAFMMFHCLFTIENLRLNVLLDLSIIQERIFFIVSDILNLQLITDFWLYIVLR